MSDCSHLQQQADQLKLDADQLRTDALASTGGAAWTKLAELGEKLLELDRKRAELDACNKAHAGATACDVVFMDAGGGGVDAPRRAELWDINAHPAALLTTAEVAAGSFAFTGPLPTGPGTRVAVVITSSDTTAVTGPDFRSGPFDLAALVASGLKPRVEIVLGPVVTITAEDIARWFNDMLSAAQPGPINVAGVGSIQASVESFAVALAPAAIRLTATGTAAGAIALIGDVQAPMSVTLTLGLVPATRTDVAVPAELTFTAPPHVDVAGPLGGYGAVLNIALAAFLGDWVLQQMRPKVEYEFTQAATRALSLVGLPPDATLSIRKLSINPAGVTIQPVIGAPGQALSAYQPQPGDLVPA